MSDPVENAMERWFNRSHGGGNPPYDSDMEQRMSAVEKSIAKIDTILPTLATKADIKDSVSATERWMIATVVGLFIGFGGLFMAMSNALRPPTAAPAAQQQAAPIIINVPGAATQPASTAK